MAHALLIKVLQVDNVAIAITLCKHAPSYTSGNLCITSIPGLAYSPYSEPTTVCQMIIVPDENGMGQGESFI